MQRPAPDIVDEGVFRGSRGDHQRNSVISRQHEFHAARAERVTVQHQKNKTHGYSVLLCG